MHVPILAFNNNWKDSKTSKHDTQFSTQSCCIYERKLNSCIWTTFSLLAVLALSALILHTYLRFIFSQNLLFSGDSPMIEQQKDVFESRVQSWVFCCQQSGVVIIWVEMSSSSAPSWHQPPPDALSGPAVKKPNLDPMPSRLPPFHQLLTCGESEREGCHSLDAISVKDFQVLSLCSLASSQ